MYEYPIFPDEVKIVIDYLANHPNFISFSPVEVAGDLKGYEATQRWISVQATGGTKELKQRVSAPRIDVNVYAESKPVAKRIALAAIAAIESMKNYTTSEAVFTRSPDVSLPTDLTDSVNSQPRYVFDATIYLRPR